MVAAATKADTKLGASGESSKFLVDSEPAENLEPLRNCELTLRFRTCRQMKEHTLMLLLIAHTKFSDFSDQRHYR